MQVSGNDACPDACGCETVTTASTTAQRSGHEARTWMPIDRPSGARLPTDWTSTVGPGDTRAPAAPTGRRARTPTTASARMRRRAARRSTGTSLYVVREGLHRALLRRRATGFYSASRPERVAGIEPA